MPAQLLPLAPALARACRRERFIAGDGSQTTIHVAEFARDRTALRVVSMPAITSLARWCRETGASDAIVGGFFTRPRTVPLGELWIDGARQYSVPFDSPWDRIRSCVSIEGGELQIGRRPELASTPRGDLLQAGPLLVEGGQPCRLDGGDPEGFSSGRGQFDSDITVGRYPRAALGIGPETVIAAVCEGRASSDAGLTLAELAAAMAAAGAETAINLDGGGSASLVFGGRLVNHPREEHGIVVGGGRPVATSVAFEPL
jgi:Phosphodiester glycosidase